MRRSSAADRERTGSSAVPVSGTLAARGHVLILRVPLLRLEVGIHEVRGVEMGTVVG